MTESLSVEDMQLLASKVDYRDWKISVESSTWEGPWIRIVATVPNAYDASGAPIDIGIDSPIPFPLIRTDEDFITWLMWRIWVMESHEAREFFTFDGNKPFDPHAEGANLTPIESNG